MKRRCRPPLRPWTPDEDERLALICSLGMVSDAWHLVLPTRSFGEILERRLDTKPPMAPLL